LFAALGIVLSFTLFLLSDFASNPFFLVPLCFVLVWLVSAFGFNTQKRWAWNMGMATAILSLLLTPLFLGPFAIIFFIPWGSCMAGHNHLLDQAECQTFPR
jgi:hypothetical protein